MRRQAFSLVELLVVITIIAVLMGLAAAAFSSARTSQSRQATQGLIAKLDAVIQQQFASYAGREVTVPTAPAELYGMTPAVYRSWFIRRNLISGDLPDRWLDVKFMAENPGDFKSPHQRAYIAVWNSMNPPPTNDEFDTHPNRDQYAGAECLFMIVMRGGIANCLDCGDLAGGRIGDKDGDGAFEFWDEWGNPIAFLLWPSAVELPAGGGVKFFSGARALEAAFPSTGPAPRPGLGMRPLIYSAGPDGEYGFETQAASSNLNVQPSEIDNDGIDNDGNGYIDDVGRDCGNWEASPASLYGGKAAGSTDWRGDNLTNFDAEARQ